MLLKSSLHESKFSRWIIFGLIIILVVGIIFRFVNIGKKPYWIDETATLTWVAGHTWSEITEKLYDNQIISIESVQEFQTTNDQRSTFDTIKTLAKDEPQHPPLYFVVLRFWVEIFGNSPAAVRSLSAIISVLTLPCLYWLCWEIFNSRSTGWIAIALASVSLHHLMYAQEARPYSLWLLIVVICNASLLRAIRLKSNLFWGAYVVSLIMGFYTSILMLPLAFGQGVYTIISGNFHLTKTLKKYLIATLISLALFSPWLLMVWLNYESVQQTTSFLLERESINGLIFKWLENTSRIFISSRPRAYAFILLLIGFSICFLCLRAPKNIKLFILTLIGSIFIPFAILDLVFGGIFSTEARYLFSYCLGIQLSVAYFLDSLIRTNFLKKAWYKWLGRFLLFALLLVGIWTCDRYIQADMGWNKGGGGGIKVADIINQYPDSLVVSDMTLENGKEDWQQLGKLLIVAHLAKPHIKLLLTIHPNELDIPKGFSDTFLLYPSQNLSQKLQKSTNYQIEKINNSLYRVSVKA